MRKIKTVEFRLDYKEGNIKRGETIQVAEDISEQKLYWDLYNSGFIKILDYYV